MKRLLRWWPVLLVWPSLQCYAQTMIPRAQDCTVIASAVERLACFDTQNGTPPNPQDGPAFAVDNKALSSTLTTAAPTLGIRELVQRNEARRMPSEKGFLLDRTDNSLVISAPALGSEESVTFLAIGCLARISHLQILSAQSIPLNQIFVRLSVDGKPLTAGNRWQVLSSGDIADAGRGLIAIDLLRRLAPGSRLQVESDYRPFDGLEFDGQGLKDLITQQREACHW